MAEKYIFARVSDRLHEKVKLKADKDGRSVNKQVIVLLERYVEENKCLQSASRGV